MRKNTIIMMGIILVYGIVYFVFGETIPKNNGFGWDGIIYKHLTEDLYGAVFIKGLDQYYIQRIFVPAVLNICFRLTGISLTEMNILWGYKIFNLVVLMISIYFYNLIARELKFNTKVTWLGFCSLFINFAILKENFYYPVLLDTAIFAIGLIQFYYYLRNNLIGLIITTIVGSFTWPNFMYSSLIFILFPIYTGNVKFSRIKIKWLIISIIIISLFICVYILYTKYEYIHQVYGVNPINSTVVPISILSLLVYFFFGLNSILENSCLYDFRNYVKGVKLKNFICAITVFFSVSLIIYLQPFNSSVNIKLFLPRTLLIAVAQPLIFLISHVIYFGPILILILFYWKNISKIVNSLGLGSTLFVIFFLFMSINSQSRLIINAVPVFIIFTLMVISKIDLKTMHIIFFFLLSIIFSKVWYTFDIKQFYDKIPGSHLHFPIQGYFMNQGPWMSFDMYVLQGVIVLITGVLMYYFLRTHYKNQDILEKN
jgi:hypothetical protein